ncbi:hypothetical protein [Streptomyces swartbergensis]|uniref:hypothetical protein n=1 Tax=Streptomyces swartbergensis TaxID=487165 RepID=UPI003823993E
MQEEQTGIGHKIPFSGAYGRNIYQVLTDFDRNRRACGPLHTRISDWLSNLEPGSASKPGHTLVLDERIEASGLT